MCIICNLRDPQNDVYAATDFLSSYRAAQAAMEKATAAMLAVSRLDLSDEDRRKYDRAHKQMKRIMRDWNMVEHTRERGGDRRLFRVTPAEIDEASEFRNLP